MSTFSDSRYRKARRKHVCIDCSGFIEVGEEYLDFRTGQHRSLFVCARCSVRRVDSCELMMRWHCAASVQRLRGIAS